jgi:hypothetical protein
MNTLSHITILDQADVEQRTQEGLWVPMNAGSGLQEVDCGDERSLTKENYQQRNNEYGEIVYPGRHFGGVAGIGNAALIALAVEQGEESLKRFVREFSPEGLVDFLATISDTADKQLKIKLNHHSAAGNEMNPLTLGDHKELNTDLGCKFEAAFGAVNALATTKFTELEARHIAEASIRSLRDQLDAAVEGARVVARLIAPEFGIGRGAIHHAQTRSNKAVPVTILEGDHAANPNTAVVIDLAGYRSNANLHVEAGTPRYHHTPQIAELFNELIPETKTDPNLLRAASLLLATSTRYALSGGDTSPTALRIEVVPPELANIA